jgi:hypothetical protein
LSCRIPFSRAISADADAALYFAGEVGAELRIDDRRLTGDVVGRCCGRENADGAFLGVRGGRTGLMGGDEALLVRGVGETRPVKPDVNCWIRLCMNLI